MQAEAGIAEFIYLVCVFTIVTNLVFNHSGRVYEAVVFKLDQFVGQKRTDHTVLERHSGYRQSRGYHVQYSRILDGHSQNRTQEKEGSLLVYINTIPLIRNDLE